MEKEDGQQWKKHWEKEYKQNWKQSKKSNNKYYDGDKYITEKKIQQNQRLLFGKINKMNNPLVTLPKKKKTSNC